MKKDKLEVVLKQLLHLDSKKSANEIKPNLKPCKLYNGKEVKNEKLSTLTF